MKNSPKKQKETELERALKEAYAPEEEKSGKGFLQHIGPGENSLEAQLVSGFSPNIKSIILKWAWLASLIMLVMGYLLIFFILFPDKRPF